MWRLPRPPARPSKANNIDLVAPPDTNGDIGPNHYVQWVNLHYQVYNRTGTPLLPNPVAGSSIWGGFGGLCETTNQGDPVVRYDRLADRWMFSQFAFNVNASGFPIAPFYQCVAVSATADPTGSFNRYSFLISNTYFNDYPKFGVWPDGYYMSMNNFSGTNLSIFNGGGAVVFERDKMLNNQPARFVQFSPLGQTFGGLLPSDLDGSILPPSGAPNYFGAVDTPAGSSSGSTFQIWKFHVDWTNTANSTFGLSNAPDFNLTTDVCGQVRLHLLSQPLDVHVNRLGGAYEGISPGNLHQLIAAEHPSGVLHQRMEKRQLPRCEPDAAPIHHRLHLLQV